MGAVYAQFELINSDDLALVRNGFLESKDVHRIAASILVDSGAYMMAITEDMKNNLALSKLGEQEVILADGTRKTLEVAGPVDIRFENRETTQRVLVLDNAAEPLIGVIPIEDLDVIIDPRKEQLVVNPESPGIARKSLKSTLLRYT